jgi:hypothetical protein
VGIDPRSALKWLFAVAARSFASVRLVVLGPMQSRGDVVGLPPIRSHELLEALVTVSPFDHDAAVCRCPDDRPGDQRLTGERPESIPDRRLERVAELVASGPPFDVDQLVAIESTEHDAVCATAAASPTAERDGRNRRAARPRVPARPTRGSGARAGRGEAAPDGCARTRARKGCGTAHLGGPYMSSTNECATRARRAGKWAGGSCAGSGPDSGARRGPARRAPLLKPQSAIAHRDPVTEPNVLADDVMLLCSASTGRTQRSAGDQPDQTEVSPGKAPMQRHWFSVHIPSTSFTSAGFRPPRPFTPTSSGLQAFRAR